jgi:FkbM family methyltransferase
MDKQYLVGSHYLRLPQDHPLDAYQAQWHRYDTSLGYIARQIFHKYPHSSCIDIGANVGDTAALIQLYQDVPVLCIEGNPEFLQYLDFNAAIVGNIAIERCFVGEDGATVNLHQISSQNGTASIFNALSSASIVPAHSENLVAKSQAVNSLFSILKKHDSFQNAKLLKTDTDGCDFSIIQQSIDVIVKLRPVIYFEYDISFKREGYTEALETIELLFANGYHKFIVYDNFGNYLISFSSANTDNFIDLNAYLISNHFKSGNIAIYYLDICAFTDEDSDLFAQIRKIETDASIIGVAKKESWKYPVLNR